MQKIHQWWLGTFLVFLGASCYGLLAIFIKLAYEDGWSVAQVTTAQVVGGLILLWLVSAIRYKKWSNPFRGSWVKLSLIGMLTLTMTTLLMNEALSLLNASLTIVLLFQFAWITLLIESALARRKPTIRELLAVVIVLLGTLLSVGGIPLEALRELSITGVILGLLSALSYSCFIVFVGRVEPNMDASVKSTVMLTASFPLVLIVYWPAEWISEVNGTLLLWALLLGLLGSALPTLLYNLGIPKIGGSAAAIVGSVELPVSLVGALFILQESVSWMQWIGMALIIFSIIISQQKLK